MNKSDTTNIPVGVAGALQPLQFPFLLHGNSMKQNAPLRMSSSRGGNLLLCNTARAQRVRKRTLYSQRDKGALIDRQSQSFISLPQVATGLRYACRARSIGGTFNRTKLCTWMAATCAVASHSFAEGGLATKFSAYKGAESFVQDIVTVPDTALDKLKIACVILLYGEVHDGDISSFD